METAGSPLLRAIQECPARASELAPREYERWVAEVAGTLGDGAEIFHECARLSRDAVLSSRLDAEVQEYQRIMAAVAWSLERFAERVYDGGVLDSGNRDMDTDMEIPADLPESIAASLAGLDTWFREIRRELDSAAAVQRLLLPKRSVMVHAAAHIAAYYRPLRGCGGDWWAAESLPGNRLLVAVGDVTGHGPAAAIMTGVARAAFDAALAMGAGSTSADILNAMNRALYGVGRGQMLMTCALSILDADADQMITANAGHVLPYVLTASMDGSRELTQVMARGNQLGAQARIELENITVPLQPGDLVLWYTDGVTECVSEQSVPFGEKKLRALLRGNQASNAAQLRDRLIDELKEHCGNAALGDDMTVVVGYALPMKGRG